MMLMTIMMMMMMHWQTRRKESQSSQKDKELNTNKKAEKSENTTNENGSTDKTDRLEKYLDDIYQKHCKFSISESEIEFIRIGVEKLTLEYLKKTYRHSPCGDVSCKVNHFSEIELVKAGSFYEGTRNWYPNEFDFIAVLGTVNEEPDENTDSHLRTGMCTRCEIYQSDEFPGASIQFCFTTGSRAHGKAETLEYLYKNGSEEIKIDVDVLFALRCYNTERYYTGNEVFNQDFYHEILKTGSFLFIYTGSSSSSSEGTTTRASNIPADPIPCHGPWDKTITETETRVVRDTLSKTHRKVYQLLKYMINGHFGEDLFKHLNDAPYFQSTFSALFGTGFCISSYAIKVAVIHHHYKCDNYSDKVGNCVLYVLEYILDAYEQGERDVFMHSLLFLDQIGSRIGRGNYEFLGTFYWCLRAFINRLASLKTADGIDKCKHDIENSFMEMALRLDIFHGYVKYLSKMNDKYSNPWILWPDRPKFDRLLKKVQDYNEKRNSIPDCPWCDYSIFTMAHKGNL